MRQSFRRQLESLQAQADALPRVRYQEAAKYSRHAQYDEHVQLAYNVHIVRGHDNTHYRGYEATGTFEKVQFARLDGSTYVAEACASQLLRQYADHVQQLPLSVHNFVAAARAIRS